MGVEPFLQEATYQHRIRALSGFAAVVRTGYFGRGRRVQAGTVSQALAAVGTTISLVCGTNPIKEPGTNSLAPRLKQIMEGWRKHDPPVQKKLPVEADVPEFLAKAALSPAATEKMKALGDWALIAFYYLLQIGEYTGGCGAAKQTKPYTLADVTFFARDERGREKRIPRDAPDAEILAACGASLKLDNMKNGWKNVCVYHEANGDDHFCPVRAAGRRYVHIRRHVRGSAGWGTYMSAYWEGGVRFDLTDKDVREGLKWAVDPEQLDYEGTKGIPSARIDTHSLRMGGANALAISGYSDTQIQKMGRWRGATFKEYIREELACYSKGMSRDMKRTFGFVNVAAGTPVDITRTVVISAYNTPAAAA